MPSKVPPTTTLDVSLAQGQANDSEDPIDWIDIDGDLHFIGFSWGSDAAWNFPSMSVKGGKLMHPVLYRKYQVRTLYALGPYLMLGCEDHTPAKSKPKKPLLVSRFFAIWTSVEAVEQSRLNDLNDRLPLGLGHGFLPLTPDDFGSRGGDEIKNLFFRLISRSDVPKSEDLFKILTMICPNCLGGAWLNRQLIVELPRTSPWEFHQRLRELFSDVQPESAPRRLRYSNGPMTRCYAQDSPPPPELQSPAHHCIATKSQPNGDGIIRYCMSCPLCHARLEYMDRLTLETATTPKTGFLYMGLRLVMSPPTPANWGPRTYTHECIFATEGGGVVEVNQDATWEGYVFVPSAGSPCGELDDTSTPP